MKATDTSRPDYYHRVVDCQWACPAHTDVPEYIRLISQQRHTDAYLLNRKSNVFPGILGRVCDRPCEPACRRGRIDEKPVAICRLKRVAADLRDSIKEGLPEIPGVKNGKRIACIGAGCASLTVANDLLPLGYDVTIFEKLDITGGLMRTNIPSFRLPAQVMDDEIGCILDMGVDLRTGSPVTSMAEFLDEGYDAIFVGTGAPLGRDLNIPGRDVADQIFVGIQWLESVAFGHVENIGERVLIIGAGNTAMDCCRTALRLGGREVKVVARKPPHMLKASDWELEDAVEERVEMVYNHAPVEFVLEDGKLTGVRFSQVEWNEDEDGRLSSQKFGEIVLPCDSVILAIGQENAFPFIERDIGIDFNRWDMPIVDKNTLQSTRDGVFFGGDAAFGPLNIIWAVEHAHQAAISINRYCNGLSLDDRPEHSIRMSSTKMGLHEWSYGNTFDGSPRRTMSSVPLKSRFETIDIEVELGFEPEKVEKEVLRCLNCDVQTVFKASSCIECDACIDVCPVDCLSIIANRSEEGLRRRLKRPAMNEDQAIYVSEPLPQTRKVMVKDEDVCIHCGLCAERCPTGAWDMQKSTLEIPYAASESCETTRKIA